MPRRSSTSMPLLMALMVVLLDLSSGVVSGIGDVEGVEVASLEASVDTVPVLKCGMETCPDKDRLPNHSPIDATPQVLEFGWWNEFWSDSDSNGMDDRLQFILSGQRESVSKTAILGEDGRLTVAIIVHYAWHPGPSDIEALRDVISSHGWKDGGSWFMVMDHLDAIVLDHVPVSSLIDIWGLDGVMLIEEQNVIVPYLDKATRGSKVRTSGVYDDSIRGLGYHGSGIVIAILDTGVDNEHFSLDDFSDNNNDNENEPDDLTDPKWVAGCDSTGIGQSGCNEEDPDDGDGHGTHVAGIALGTGHSSRVVQGYAPGAYLVDVKVMEDYGGGNSQSILAGLQWVINNRDTDWGNNESSRGIQVVSMSFGRASTVGDNNEDGSSAEASLVNQASENGLVCVAAIGNDGENNVNSVGAADTAITVGWLDDKNTIDRDDDTISSSSNYGPRQDDGDGDSYDELKPWVVAPGSNINSAKHAESSGIIPGSEVNRASDDYVQMSGSSMSTPAVAGLIAIMLEIGEVRKMDFMESDGIGRSEAIRDYLMSNSEFRDGWTEDEIYEGERWNTRYGFGIIDGGDVASGMFNIEVNASEGPGLPREGHWVDIESPSEFSWVIEGESYNLRGHINEHGEDNGSIEEVLVYVEIEYKKAPDEPKNKTILLDWRNPIGIVNWTASFNVPELPEEFSEILITAKVAARNEFGSWSDLTEFEYPVGEVNITLDGPSGQSDISGTVAVSGEFQSIRNATIQWRLDNEDWENAAFYYDGLSDDHDVEHSPSSRKADGSGHPAWQGHAYCAHQFRESHVSQQSDSQVAKCVEGDYGWMDWNFNWDTTQLKDGEYRLAVRVVSATGVVSEEIRRIVTIDNVPPSPDLVFVSKSISVEEYGISMSEAYVNTFLEVRATMRNIGDKAATEIGVILEDDGARKDEYVIPTIDTGDYFEIVLFWNPTNSGDVEVAITIDPLNAIEELDESNNKLTGIFPVLPRPPGVDLAIRPGGISTTPAVPRPNEQVLVEARVDNLGSTEAVGVEGSLEILTDRGWEQVATASAAFVLGGSHSQLSFVYTPNQTGPLDLRVNVIIDDGSDLDWSNNAFSKTILVDRSTLTGPRTAELNSGEIPIKIINLDEKEGGIVVSEKKGTLYLYKLTSSKSLVPCTNIMEDRWSGDLVVRSTEDGIAHMVWTRRYLDSNGFLMQTLSYSTIDPTCKMAPTQDLLDGIPLTDGKYWGINMDVSDSEILVAGYYRDLFNGGTMEEITNIFLLHADSPISSADWTLNPRIISDIEVPPASSDSLAIEFGHERGHLLYQAIRNDSTGVERLGLWYAHGGIDQMSWSYRKAVGDEAALPQMSVIVEDEEERIIALWREGEPQDSELLAIVADSTFKPEDGMEDRFAARGLSSIGVVETERGIQILFDYVGPSGPQVEYGIIDYEIGWIGLSNRVVSGQFDAIDRSTEMGETVMVLTSPSGWSIRSLIDDGGGSKNDGTLVERLRSSLGLDESSFEILVIGVAFAVLILGSVALVSLSAQGLRWASRRRAIEDEDAVLMEDDVIDLIGGSDLSIDSNEVEIVDSLEVTNPTGADERRARRARRGDSDSVYEPSLSEEISTKPLPEIPAQMAAVLNTGSVSRPVVCGNCDSRFVVSSELAFTRCPVCEERVNL